MSNNTSSNNNNSSTMNNNVNLPVSTVPTSTSLTSSSLNSNSNQNNSTASNINNSNANNTASTNNSNLSSNNNNSNNIAGTTSVVSTPNSNVGQSNGTSTIIQNSNAYNSNNTSGSPVFSNNINNNNGNSAQNNISVNGLTNNMSMNSLTNAPLNNFSINNLTNISNNNVTSAANTGTNLTNGGSVSNSNLSQNNNNSNTISILSSSALNLISNSQINLQQQVSNTSTTPQTASTISSFLPSETTTASYTPSMVTQPNNRHPINNNQIEYTKDTLEQLVSNLIIPEKRNDALLVLSKERAHFKDIALVLWYSFGSITALLQEIVSIYPYLSPPTLKTSDSDRVCNAIALLHSLANHPGTRQQFIDAQIPFYLFPFLNTVTKTEAFEFTRLTSLSVIGALVKADDPYVISFLLKTEIIPLCIRIIDIGCQLSKTVAVFIILKILMDDQGLAYICATPERFHAISSVLNNLIQLMTISPCPRILRHVIRCYYRLCDDPRSKEALKSCLPSQLRDDTFLALVQKDNSILYSCQQLLYTLFDSPPIDVSTQAQYTQNMNNTQNYPHFPNQTVQQQMFQTGKANNMQNVLRH